MKEFYSIANKVLLIRRNNPVVTRVKRDTESGDPEIFEDRTLVEEAIAGYFTGIYKRPTHMVGRNSQRIEGEDTVMEEESINTSALFSIKDIVEATKNSNFNKGLGPDCFDGNVLKKDE